MRFFSSLAAAAALVATAVVADVDPIVIKVRPFVVVNRRTRR